MLSGSYSLTWRLLKLPLVFFFPKNSAIVSLLVIAVLGDVTQVSFSQQISIRLYNQHFIQFCYLLSLLFIFFWLDFFNEQSIQSLYNGCNGFSLSFFGLFTLFFECEFEKTLTARTILIQVLCVINFGFCFNLVDYIEQFFLR